MAKEQVKPTLLIRASAELIGTLIFVFISAGSVVATNFLVVPNFASLLFVALATGLALALVVSSTMHISGGYINPAVTIGILTAKRIKLSDAAVYIVAQIVGAIIGAYILFAFFQNSLGSSVYWGTPTLAGGISPLRGIVIEAMLTFILVFVVFGTIVDKRAAKIGGIGVGLAVLIDAMIGGYLTGAAVNPARWAGPAIASFYLANWYVYWVGPVIGAVLAALVYRSFLLKE